MLKEGGGGGGPVGQDHGAGLELALASLRVLREAGDGGRKKGEEGGGGGKHDGAKVK